MLGRSFFLFLSLSKPLAEMFWRFNYLTSEIDTLLDKEDVTLKDILSEEDVLQECKAQNKKLVDFLVRPEHFGELVNLVITEPSSETDERMRYKFPNIACELITSDVNQITETLAGDTPLLTKMVNYLDNDSPLNPLQASFFSKVMGLLITRKSELTLSFLKSRENFISRVLHHLDTSAIMDLLLRLITSMESQECKNACVVWLSEQQVIQKLVQLLDQTQSSETHSNAAQSLCDIIRISREQLMQFQEQSIPDSLLLTIESEEVVSMLLDQMFNAEGVESILTNGLYILQTLLEFRKTSAEGQPESLTPQEVEKMVQGVSNTLKAIVPRLKDFHKLLHEPPKQHYLPMPTTLGILDQPLGNTRLQTVRLIAFLLATNRPPVNEELARLGTLNTILNLYFEYMWNNFLHTQVEQCISAIVQTDSADNEHILVVQLITECKLLERIVDAFDKNQQQQAKAGGHRQGHMGHLTKIANSIVNNKVSRQNSQKIDELIKGLSEDLRNRWSAFVSGTLAEINKQNSTDLVGGTASMPSSADPDDGFQGIAFPQEVAMQKLGFNGDDFCEQEDNSGVAFSDLSSRLSSLSPTSCENSSSAQTMFEEMCSERSQLKQLPDRDNEANEEDLWEEKELTFSPLSTTTPTTTTPKSNVQETTAAGKDEKEDGEGKDSDDSDDEDLDSPWQIHQVPEAASSTPRVENVVEDMEVTTDDWAKFDEMPMDVAPVVAPSPWATGVKDATSTATGGDGGWAKFETGQVAGVRNNESDSGWANFSPMNWTEQEDANTASPAVSQVTDVRTAAYAVTNDESVGPAVAVVTDDIGKHPTGNNAAVDTVTSSSAGSSGMPQGPFLSSAIENGPA